MPTEPHAGELDKTHVEMWKHYEDLRQKKHSTFMTANTLFLAILSFGLKEASGPMDNVLVLLALVGIAIAVAWFLMLTRNSLYVGYHRERVGKAWATWSPNTLAPSSKQLDRALPSVFALFWTLVFVALAVDRAQRG